MFGWVISSKYKPRMFRNLIGWLTNPMHLELTNQRVPQITCWFAWELTRECSACEICLYFSCPLHISIDHSIWCATNALNLETSLFYVNLLSSILLRKYLIQINIWWSVLLGVTMNLIGKDKIITFLCNVKYGKWRRTNRAAGPYETHTSQLRWRLWRFPCEPEDQSHRRCH